MAENKTITISLLPSQRKFVNSKKKHILFSGGFGSGKSRALCYALLKEAVIPGHTLLLIRKTMVALKKSTLMTLIGGTDPVLPRGSFSYNKTEGIVSVNGGATIYCCGMEDPQRIRSMNLGGAYVDEVTEFNEDEFREITYRLRGEGCRQTFSCGNPAGQTHWLYKHFFLDNNRNREVITASSLENTHLPADYLDELRTMEGSRYKRFVEGLWVSLEDGIFDTFSRSTHVKTLPKMMPFDSFTCGLDMGYTHPAAITVSGISGDRMYVIEEWRKSKCLLKDILDEVLRIRDKYQPVFVYDPSAAALGGEMRNLGIEAFPADNDVAASIDRIRNRLRVRNDSPDMVVSDACPMTIAELENYSYQTGTERPIKQGDDLVDTIRYQVNRLDNERAEHPTAPFLMTGGDDDQAGEGWERLG